MQLTGINNIFTYAQKNLVKIFLQYDKILAYEKNDSIRWFHSTECRYVTATSILAARFSERKEKCAPYLLVA